MTTIFSPDVRRKLEWSWNYAIAENMGDDTYRHNAQWISMGIDRGEDASDEDLVNDWLANRVTDLETLVASNEWESELSEKLRTEIRALPEFEALVERLKENQ